MKKRQLGSSELFVSEMGLGCMSLGTDEKEANYIIKSALEHGVNYFDTADLYDFGLNEKIIGKTLKSVRDEVIIATKVGNKWGNEQDRWIWDASKAYIKEAVKKSLLRLQTNYIDLYQLHGGTMTDNHEEVIEAFEELRREGIIRYYGISSIRPNVIQSFATQSNIISVMMQYSLLDRRPEEWLSILKENQISMIARGPIAKGILTEKALEKSSTSLQENGFLDYSYNQLESLLLSLKEHFSTQRSIQEVAFQYILSCDVVGAVIPGASNAAQVIDNIKAVQANPLTDEELQFLHSITIANKYQQHRL